MTFPRCSDLLDGSRAIEAPVRRDAVLIQLLSSVLSLCGQESLANAKVSARQQCVYEGFYSKEICGK